MSLGHFGERAGIVGLLFVGWLFLKLFGGILGSNWTWTVENSLILFNQNLEIDCQLALS
jgi:hypothetical protein